MGSICRDGWTKLSSNKHAVVAYRPVSGDNGDDDGGRSSFDVVVLVAVIGILFGEDGSQKKRIDSQWSLCAYEPRLCHDT
jgi:hypothetical protein